MQTVENDEKFSRVHISKGVENNGKKTKDIERQRKKEPLVVTEERPGTGTPVFLPVLVALAAKQSVKARLLYYRHLIGFLKVKCISHPCSMTRV